MRGLKAYILLFCFENNWCSFPIKIVYDVRKTNVLSSCNIITILKLRS